MEDISIFPYLFDRRRASHPWLPGLDELQLSDYPESRALASNWRMDHRVSEGREDEMTSSGLFPDSANAEGGFGVAVSRYFRDHLCVPAVAAAGARSPAYASTANTANRIPSDRISPNQQLLHLASLNALLPRVLRETDFQLALFDLTGEYAPEHDEITPENVESIALALRRAGDGAVREFAGLISDQLGATEPHWWSAFSFEVDEYLHGDDWTAAARILGLAILRRDSGSLPGVFRLSLPVPCSGPPLQKRESMDTIFRHLREKRSV